MSSPETVTITFRSHIFTFHLHLFSKYHEMAKQCAVSAAIELFFTSVFHTSDFFRYVDLVCDIYLNVRTIPEWMFVMIARKYQIFNGIWSRIVVYFFSKNY